jgi:hypothetical protein
MICSKYFFQKLSHFLHGMNVLDAATSSIQGFLWRGTRVSLTLVNRLIWSKESLSPH